MYEYNLEHIAQLYRELPANHPFMNVAYKPDEFVGLFEDFMARRSGLRNVPTIDHAIDLAPDGGPGLLINKEIILDFLQQSHGDRPRHLVAINPEGGTGSVVAKTFEASDTAGLLRWIGQKNGRRHWGIYYHVNELTPDCRGHRAKKTDIASAHFTHVDVDDTEAKARIATFDPAPTVVIMSGGGFNCLWSIEPTPDLAAVEEVNQAIEHTLTADHCHNIDRVLRLPGTINYPNAKKIAKGRTPAQAYIVEELTDWTRSYELAAFDHLPRAPQPEQRKAAPIKTDGPPREHKPVADHIMDIVERGAPEGERSHAFFDVMKHLKGNGYTIHEAYELLDRNPSGIAAKYDDRLFTEIERVYSKDQ